MNAKESLIESDKKQAYTDASAGKCSPAKESEGGEVAKQSMSQFVLEFFCHLATVMFIAACWIPLLFGALIFCALYS